MSRIRALVTGGTGFIGSHLVELLLQKGWVVVCPVRNTKVLRHLTQIPAKIISWNELESETRREPFFDYIIHVAGATRACNYKAYLDANVNQTRYLLELIASSPGKNQLKKFVLIGSQAAAGPSPENGMPITETDSPKPISLYGKSKLEAEKIALSFSNELPVTILHPSTVFGPRDTDVLGMFKCAKFGIAPYLAGSDRLVSIIYVEDLIEAILAAALSSNSTGQKYFLANERPVIWREFACEIVRMFGHKPVPIPVPLAVMRLMALGGELLGHLTNRPQLLRKEKFEEMRQIAWVCSTQKASRELAWEPRIPLPEAIAKTAKWYRDCGWI